MELDLDLLRRENDDLSVAPHNDRLAESLVASEGLTHGQPHRNDDVLGFEVTQRYGPFYYLTSDLSGGKVLRFLHSVH